MRHPSERWLFALVAYLWACSAPNTVRESGAGDATSSGCGRDCSDNVACTEDRCENWVCVHVPQTALCMGNTCDPRSGCVTRACATPADCVDSDACTVEETCDSASRTCRYRLLDGDHDGAPAHACGGSDCDDSNAAVKPGASELCNGLDDNCNGVVDEPGTGGTGDCPGRACVAGRCEGACLEGFTLCGDSCRDLARDEGACGACGQRCLTGACVAGRCTCARASEVLCPRAGDPMTLECADTSIDTAHCGSCGHACARGQDCVSGTCECRSGYTTCPGQSGCVDLQTDFGNCGRCGNACPGGLGMRVCSLGRCTCTYVRPGDGRELPGFACGAECIPVDGFQTDPMNCGTCGNVCPSGLVCRDGACACPNPGSSPISGRCVCNAGLTDCCPPDARDSCVGGLWCVETSSHAAHCGACGVSCGLGGRCVAGHCEWSSCALPPMVCGGVSTCPASDPRNCGSCGNACAAGRTCVRGMCT